MKNFAIVLILAMAAGAWGALGTITTSNQTADSIHHDTVLNNGELVDTAAGNLRTRKITVAGMTEPVISTIGSDKRDPVAVYDGKVWAYDSTRLYTTTDTTLATWATAFNLATPVEGDDTPYAYYTATGYTISWLAFSGDVGLMSVGSVDTTVDGTAILGKIFRTTDKGATWTKVLDCIGGKPVHIFFEGNEAICGEYNNRSKFNATYGVGVYYSSDYGQTFEKIWTETECVTTGRHVHKALIMHRNGNTEAIVMFGDGLDTDARVIHLRKPVDWTTGSWDLVGQVSGDELLQAYYNPADDRVYGQIENELTCGVVSYDLTNYRKKVHFYKYNPNGNGYAQVDKSSPYSVSAGMTGGLWRAGNTWYITQHELFGGTQYGNVGVYVSQDMENFTAIYRCPTSHGIRNIVGLYNNKLIGRYISNTGSIATIGIPLVNTEVFDGYVVQKGYKNQILSADNSTFDTSIGDWRQTGGGTNGRATISWSATGGLHGGGCMKIDPVAGQTLSSIRFTGPALLAGTPPYLATISFWARIDGPTTGKKPLWYAYPFSYSPRSITGFADNGSGLARATTSAAHGYSNGNQVYITTSSVAAYNGWHIISDVTTTAFTIDAAYDGTSTASATGESSGSSKYVLTENWRRFQRSVYVSVTNFTQTIKFDLVCSKYNYLTDDEVTATDIYVDAISVNYSTDRYIYESDIYHPANLTTDDDYKTYAINGGGSNWTVTGEWIPLHGYLDFPAIGEEVTTLPIVTMVDDEAGYVALQWNRADGKFELTDGTNTVQLTPTTPIDWRHWDNIKFAVSSNGTDSTFYIFTPTNYFYETDSILSVSCEDVGFAGDLTRVVLGANSNGSNIGCGVMGRITQSDSVLTEQQITNIFNVPTDISDRFSGGRFSGGRLVNYE